MSYTPNIQPNILFETESTLGASASFTGDVLSIEKYQQVQTHIVSDQDGTMKFEFATDAAGTNVKRTLNIPYVATSGYQLLSAPCFTPYVRYSYTNGSTPQTNFYYSTKGINSGLSPQVIPLNGNVVGGMVASVSRSVEMGTDPNGSYVNGPIAGVDGNNSTSTPLNATQEFTGTWSDISTYHGISVLVDGYGTGSPATTAPGTLYMEFSHDSVITHRSITIPVSDLEAAPPRTLGVVAKYFRVRYVNGAVNQASFDIQTMFHSEQVQLVSRLDSSLTGNDDVTNVRSVIVGQTDGGTYKNVPVTGQGHIEVALHDPINPFGSVHTEKLTPVFQSDAIYGIRDTELTTTGFGGTATTENGMFKVASGATQYGNGSIQSKKRLRYRPGQGVVGKFSALFTTPLANTVTVTGYGSAESGFYWGYNGTSFGVLHSTDGVRAIHTLTVTTGSTATDDYDVELDGTTYSITATNNSSTLKTAYEISEGTYPGWTAEQRGSTVVFTSGATGAKAGSFSLAQGGAGTPAAGSFATTLTGVAVTDTWVATSSFNGDKLDGTGASGFTLDPTKGTEYEISVPYAFGPVQFSIIVSDGDNNPTKILAHTIDMGNNRTTPSVSQPSFPFTMATVSNVSSSDVGCSVAAYSGFIEGDIHLNGPSLTYEDVSTAVSTGSYFTLLTLRNDSSFAGRANQSTVRLTSFAGAHDDATPITFYLIKNATLVGTPDYQQHSTESCTYVDTAATTCTITDNSQILVSVPSGQTGTVLLDLLNEIEDITLQPGDTLTLAAKAVTGTSTYTIMTLNTREDQ